MVLSQVSVFADTASVPMLLTVEPTPLDYTVTERIDMSVYQGETALNMNSVTVTNTGAEDLKVSSIAINPASGWTVEASSTDFATASKTALSFTCNNHDFSTGAYAPGDALTAGGNLTYTLSGQISAKADLMSATQVASMVVTVEKNVTLISFTIDGTSYQAEEGMTWEEWVSSDYNIDNEYMIPSPNQADGANPNNVGKYQFRTWWFPIHNGSDCVHKTDVIIDGFAYTL